MAPRAGSRQGILGLVSSHQDCRRCRHDRHVFALEKSAHLRLRAPHERRRALIASLSPAPAPRLLQDPGPLPPQGLLLSRASRHGQAQPRRQTGELPHLAAVLGPSGVLQDVPVRRRCPWAFVAPDLTRVARYCLGLTAPRWGAGRSLSAWRLTSRCTLVYRLN